MTETTTADWVERIRTAQAAADAAEAAVEVVIRDARFVGGMTETAIARDALGTTNRKRVRRILGAGDDGGAPTRPHWPVAALVTGARSTLYDRIVPELWARGIDPVGHAEAWHLSRGGVTVVAARVDYENDSLHLAQVRAIHGSDGDLAWRDIGESRSVPAAAWHPDATARDGSRGAWGMDAPAIARAIAQAARGDSLADG